MGWIVAGVAAVTVVALVVAVNNTPDIGFKYPPEGCISDERLKRNIIYFETLPNGLKLYSFRYWNDNRSFVGVMAQDLMEDRRFSHAVVEDDSGYYRVDFAALGRGIRGSSEQFIQAGQRAGADAGLIAK